ncbi:MAG: ATP synthase F1 subunit delta [Bacteroidetes bacterium]|nr:MAG: ATP synthase F1 subunit delta [Bacteroidota bacterium]
MIISLENISHIAVPYAKALFEFALERDAVESVHKDMQALTSLCKSNRDFLLMLKSPILKTEKKQKILTAVFKDSISEITRGFLKIITAKRRELLLPDMAVAFVELYKDYKGILTTIVKTAVPLTEDVRKKILEVMSKQTKGKVDLVEEIKEELIGGFVLQWKDMQYDASILNEVNKMRKAMAMINLYKKGF